MKALDISHFTETGRDVELRKYEFRHALQKVESHFRHNELYPYLSKLVELRRGLVLLVDCLEKGNEHLPKTLNGIDLTDFKLVYETEAISSEIKSSIELSKWAFPLLSKLIDIGATIHDFVESAVTVNTVGMVPNYLDEGYFFMNVPEKEVLFVYRYELSIYMSSDGKFRTMRTKLLEEQTLGKVVKTPAEVKLGLIQHYPDLPNPATFACLTNLDFPYESSLFPVVKRKLMQALAA